MSEALPPFRELSHFEIDPAAVQLLGHGWCEKKHVVVLGRVDPQARDPITVAMTDPGDAQLLEALQSFLERPIVPVRLSAWEIRRALDIGYGRLDPTADPGRIVLPDGASPSFAPGHPIPALALELLSRAVGLSAREIHVERWATDVDVRLRIDGVLHPFASPLAPDNAGAFVAYLATLAGLPEAGDGPRSGTIRATLGSDTGGRPLDLRLSLLPGAHGDDATLHVLDRGAPARSLAEIGLRPDQHAAVQHALSSGGGLVLVAAPEGHGRTSTLHALLGEMQPEVRKVMSVERPVERTLAKVVQRSAPDDASAATIARACLDHGPDVLAIGDVDTPALAEVVTTALRRGVRVVAVVEARDACAGLVAMRRLGVPDTEIAEAFALAISPRLMPRLCPACRRLEPIDPHATALAAAGRPVRAHAAPGCEACHGLGHAGRVAAVEVVTSDAALVRAIEAAAPATELRAILAAAGVPAPIDLAVALADAGEVALSSVQALPGAAARLGAQRRHG